MPLRPDLGNAIWFYLHTLSHLAATKESLYSQLYTSAALLVPCDRCRMHFKQNISTNEYKELLTNFEKLNYLHNQVNILLKKKKQIYTLNESIALYQAKSADLNLIKTQFFKIVLTYAHYWNNKYWKNNINIKFTDNFKYMLKNTIDLLNLNHEPIDTLLTNTPVFYQYNQVYDLLLQYGLQEAQIPRGFTYNTSGCNCINQ